MAPYIMEEYIKACKAGKRDYQARMMKGQLPTLQVLDEILPPKGSYSEVPLGLVQIPIDQIVGTKSGGRSNAFAGNFMPILRENTEFAYKWATLSQSHIDKGIREPIKAYEYMNKFYVQEGNKRVSVLKYFDAVSVPGYVTRILPQRTEQKENKIYYEYVDFYALSQINYIWFSQEGCFRRLLELTSPDPDAEWTDEQKLDFGSANHRFCVSFKALGGDKLPLTNSDTLLIFIDIYGYEAVKNMTEAEMKEKIKLLWDEFLIESKGREVELHMEPTKLGRKKLMDYFRSSTPKKVMVAFVFNKDPQESEWLYGHELGRLYLDEHYPDTIKTLKVHNIASEEEAISAMEDLIAMGVSIIFTTTPQLISASVKVAVNHPEATIMNCSLNTSHKVISTYYARLYEVKFLAGMIAGALSKNGKIGYVADYPIVGMTANINAFALGARMVNPYAKVYLEWTTVKGNTREHILICYADDRLARSIGGGELIKIKFELDTTPPPFASFEQKYRLLPLPYEIRLYDMPSLFAGKLHAVICRAWKSRIKGRDLYDYIFYLSRKTPVNLKHLNARLVDSGFEGAREDMMLPEIKQILLQRFSSIDYSQAKEDVLPFIRNPASLDVWSASFFQTITENLTAQ